MKKYELALVLSAKLDDDARADIVEKAKGYVTRYEGVIGQVEEWGKRRLAYEIAHQREGFYYFIHFEAQSGAPAQIESHVRIMDGVLRFLIVVQEGDDFILPVPEEEAVEEEADNASPVGEVPAAAGGEVEASPVEEVPAAADGEVEASPVGEVSAAADGEVEASPVGEVSAAADGEVTPEDAEVAAAPTEEAIENTTEEELEEAEAEEAVKEEADTAEEAPAETPAAEE